LSSAYHLLCLSHDPAIVVDYDFTYDGIKALASRDHEALRDHADCDIVAGRFSYPLIEVGCFGLNLGGRRDAKAYHRGIIWTDTDWLRLLHAARTPPGVVGDDILRLNSFRCWPPERLNRLRNELGLAVPDEPVTR
jgi:hypothetical protein